jgi:transcription elongation GreA/GreB family factor
MTEDMKHKDDKTRKRQGRQGFNEASVKYNEAMVNAVVAFYAANIDEDAFLVKIATAAVVNSTNSNDRDITLAFVTMANASTASANIAVTSAINVNIVVKQKYSGETKGQGILSPLSSP